MEREIMSLPMLALRGMVVMPEQVTHFDVSREKSLKAIEKAMLEDQKIFLVAQKEIETEDPGMGDVYKIGCVASIKQIVKLPKKISRVVVSGEKRARLDSIPMDDPYLRADIEVVDDVDTSVEDTGADKNPLNLEAMIRGLKDIFKEYLAKNPKTMKEIAAQIDETQELKKLVNIIGSNLPMKYTEAQALLEETHVMRRFDILTGKIVNEIQVLNIKEELQAKIKERVDKNQR